MIAQAQAERLASLHRRHCEEPTGDAAISWYRVQIRSPFQEIATPSARDDAAALGCSSWFAQAVIAPTGGDFSLVLLVWLGSYPAWSVGS